MVCFVFFQCFPPYLFLLFIQFRKDFAIIPLGTIIFLLLLRILVIICIFEMVSSYHLMIWAMDIGNFIEFFKVEAIWKAFLFNKIQGDSNIIERNECLQNQYVYFLSLFFEFNYYIVLCLDLIITLKQPLISGKQRMKWYHLGVILASLIQFIFTQEYINIQCEYTSIYTDNQEKPLLFISYRPVILSEILFYLLGIISIIMALRNLYKSKQNAAKEIYEAKNNYVLNHISMVLLVIAIWLVPFINNLKMIIEFGNSSELLNYISFTILISQGIFLAIIRLREKFFRLRLKGLIMSFFGFDSLKKEIDEIESQDQEDEEQWNFSLATLIRKVQNQEVLNNILQGVLSIIQHQNAIPIVSLDTNLQQIKKWTQEKKSKIFSSGQSYSAEIQEQLLKQNTSSFDIKVTEYAQRVFQGLRQLDDLNNDKLISSLSVEKNVQQIKQAQKSMGRSGSFFFFSYDNLLILKTITQKELKILLNKFLTDYVEHLIRDSNDSLIARVYGAYTVSIQGVSPIHLILMENTLGILKNKVGNISRMYDLKGSLANRKVKIQSECNFSNYTRRVTHQEYSGQVNDELIIHKKLTKIQQIQVLKDVNFLESTDLFIQLGNEIREVLLEQIKSDTEFFKSIRIMDYSLLVGLTSDSNQLKFINSFKFKLCRIDKQTWRCCMDIRGQSMSFAIIDYLQLFDLSKYVELKYKTLIKKEKKEFLSCIMPDEYQARFSQFINFVIIAVIKH